MSLFRQWGSFVPTGITVLVVVTLCALVLVQRRVVSRWAAPEIAILQLSAR